MIREPYDMDEAEKEKHEKDFGRFNDPPPNLTAITDQEFWSQFMTWQIRTIEYRQAKVGDRYLSMKMFFTGEGEGLAVTWDASRIDFYKFAVCVHDFRSRPIARCLTRYICYKCGYTKEIDSSD